MSDTTISPDDYEPAPITTRKRTAAKTAKKRGRKPTATFVSYDEAKDILRKEMLHSKSAFDHWWASNKPKTIPRFPYRVYKDWVSWNDFLGNDNKFAAPQKVWRPYHEAAKWVHTLNLRSYNEWNTWAKMDGNLPDDIPARPDIVYKQWTSWTQWLGNTPEGVTSLHQDMTRFKVLYVLHEPGTHENVYRIGVDSSPTVTKKRWENGATIMKMFWHDSSKTDIVRKAIDGLTSPYMGDEKVRMIPNLWELLWVLSTHLVVVTPGELKRFEVARQMYVAEMQTTGDSGDLDIDLLFND